MSSSKSAGKDVRGDRSSSEQVAEEAVTGAGGCSQFAAGENMDRSIPIGFFLALATGPSGKGFLSRSLGGELFGMGPEMLVLGLS